MPDGYTISFGHSSTHVVNGAIYPLTFDLLNDFEPVALIASNPQLLVEQGVCAGERISTNSSRGCRRMRTTTSARRASGRGSHFSGLYFQNVTGTKFPLMPYRGTGPAMQDLVAGQIDLIFDQASNAMPQVQGGKIKAYAVTAKKRLPAGARHSDRG